MQDYEKTSYQLKSPALVVIKEPERSGRSGKKVVEMVRVELTSESIFAGISPSAASDLAFRLADRPQANRRFSYPVSPSSYRELT